MGNGSSSDPAGGDPRGGGRVDQVKKIVNARALLDERCSQATEGMWGMPGHTEAMKAVVSCDKLGGVAHTR